MSAAAYSLSSHTLILRDSPERIDYHIKSGDYFSFLATMMGFLEETIEKGDSSKLSQKERDMARELRRDLRYVQANYKIEPRQLGDVQTMRSSGNLLSRD